MFRHMGLGTKIGFGFILVLILTGIVSFVGWDGLRKVLDRVDKADEMSRMIEMVLQARRHEKNFIIRSEKEYKEKVEKQIDSLKKQAVVSKDKFKDPLNKEQMDKVLAATDRYEKTFLRLVDLQGKEIDKEQRTRELQAIDAELIPTGRAVEKECAEARTDQRQKMMAQISRTNKIIGFGALGALAAGLLLSFLITRSITNPVNRVIRGISDGAKQAVSAAGQVSLSSQAVAEGASEQAAGLEETSSSLEEVTSMVRRNAGNAQQAETFMKKTSTVVEEADIAVKELTQSMNDISTSGEETAKIIKTIDEIAFQTNLLALNAAVEAARAGEAGAGFAVVADEVRNLAMRAAEAAKNTSNLIEGIITKIKNGSDLVSKANESFGNVAVESMKVSGLVSEIASASQNQAQGIEQITRTVTEMDKVVQQNAANAEESAAAAEEMSAQAEQMKGFVGELVALVEGRGHRGEKWPK